MGRVSPGPRKLPRIADLGFDWIYLNPFHQTGGSKSLYAVADTDRLDERLRDEDGTPDDEQIRRFCAAARAAGISVMTDLVINHTADNARLVQDRPDLFMREPDGSIMHPAAVDPDDPSIRTVWGDLAELDYHSPAARQALTEIFTAYVARMQDLGVGGFRCDAAYKVPPEVWRVLIAAAKEKDPACPSPPRRWAAPSRRPAPRQAPASTTCSTPSRGGTSRPLGARSVRAPAGARPSIAFPENHDMKRLAAEIGGGPEAVAAHLRTRYALASFFSAGVLMPIGYEWGYRRALHVVETHPGDRESDTGIDISASIRAINALKAELPAANVEGAQQRLSSPDAGFIALVATTPATTPPQHAVLVLYNPTGAPVTVEAGPLIARTGGMLGPSWTARPRRSHRLPRRKPRHAGAGRVAHPRREPSECRPPAYPG